MTYIPSPTHPRLIIQGGRTDPSGGYTYTSAPLLGETLILPLWTGFDTDVPPWEVQSVDLDTGAGIAWQTTGYLLDIGGKEYLISFGGDGGPTLPVQTGNDSLRLYSLQTSTQETGMAMSNVDLPGVDEPMRRWYPSSGSLDKRTWLITGGLKGDGSGLGFGDVYSVSISDTETVVFEQEGTLPTDLAGHGMVIGGDGSVWLVGGWVPSAGRFLPLSTAYVRTPGTVEWEIRELSSSTELPQSRRGHSAVLVSPTKAILYGGSASLSSGDLGSGAMGDMWELDLERGAWTVLRSGQISDGSDPGTGRRAIEDGPGERFEHAAVGVGGRVLIFGGESLLAPFAQASTHTEETYSLPFGMIGRTISGMADAGLYVYDVDSDQWITEFPEVSRSASDDVHGVAADDDDLDENGTEAGQLGSDASSEIVVTRTDDNGGIVLSTRTTRVGVQTTKVIVVTGTSTDLIVSTDRAGLTGESQRAIVRVLSRCSSTTLGHSHLHPRCYDPQDIDGDGGAYRHKRSHIDERQEQEHGDRARDRLWLFRAYRARALGVDHQTSTFRQDRAERVHAQTVWR